MPRLSSQRGNRSGITVLALALLIIAVMVGGFFLVRYLRSRQAVSFRAPANVILSGAKDLKLCGSEIPRFARNDISARAS